VYCMQTSFCGVGPNVTKNGCNSFVKQMEIRMSFRVLRKSNKTGGLWRDPNFRTGDGIDFAKTGGWISCPMEEKHNRPSIRYFGPRYYYEDPSELVERGAQIYYAYPDILIHHKLRDRMQEAGLTGWQFNQAYVRFANDEVSEDFGEFWVSGFGGIAPPEMGNRLLWVCRGCGMRKYDNTIRFSELNHSIKWDGSDFFIVWPFPYYYFCSPKAQEVIKDDREDFELSEVEKVRIGKSYGDMPVPPYYSQSARDAIERYWAAAPVWPDCMDLR
jgi:hypothetical protein